MKFDRSFIKSLPKVLLHEHLDGVLRPQTVIELAREVGYRPSTELEQGVKQFVEWYLSYYHRDLELKPT